MAYCLGMLSGIGNVDWSKTYPQHLCVKYGMTPNDNRIPLITLPEGIIPDANEEKYGLCKDIGDGVVYRITGPCLYFIPVFGESAPYRFITVKPQNKEYEFTSQPLPFVSPDKCTFLPYPLNYKIYRVRLDTSVFYTKNNNGQCIFIELGSPKQLSDENVYKEGICPGLANGVVYSSFGDSCRYTKDPNTGLYLPINILPVGYLPRSSFRVFDLFDRYLKTFGNPEIKPYSQEPLLDLLNTRKWRTTPCVVLLKQIGEHQMENYNIIEKIESKKEVIVSWTVTISFYEGRFVLNDPQYNRQYVDLYDFRTSEEEDAKIMEVIPSLNGRKLDFSCHTYSDLRRLNEQMASFALDRYRYGDSPDNLAILKKWEKNYKKITTLLNKVLKLRTDAPLDQSKVDRMRQNIENINGWLQIPTNEFFTNDAKIPEWEGGCCISGKI